LGLPGLSQLKVKQDAGATRFCSTTTDKPQGGPARKMRSGQAKALDLRHR